MPNQDSPLAQELLAHQVFLRRLAVDLVGEDADDLVQDVWQRALERPPRHGGQLRGWLARVARNLAANRWRGDARRAEREALSGSGGPAAEEVEARFELRKELVETLDALPRHGRETILLRYFEGLGPREIARRQGTPVATVKTRLRRALAELREALDRKHGGERGTWMPAVAALVVPAGRGAGSGTLVIGGILVGTTMKVAAAALVAALGLYFVTRTPRTEPPSPAEVQASVPEAELVERVGAEDALAGGAFATGGARESARRSPVAGEASAIGPVGSGRVLRVVLEELGEEDARLAAVTLAGVGERDGRSVELGYSWPVQGLTSEFDLAAVLARVEQDESLREGELEVAVDHPHRFAERVRVAVTGELAPASGPIVHEVRVRLERPEFWPEFSLSVRDAHTRAHLDDVELRIASGPSMASWGRNAASTLLGQELSSPVALMGGREPGELAVAGMALSPVPGDSPRLVELALRWPPERGVKVSARAPGYAWGSTSVDVSKGDRELLLEPAGGLSVELANVRLERYAALETEPMLCIYWIREDGGNTYVRFEPLDETLRNDGLRLDSLRPGGYRVAVELGGGAWTEQPVLALEEVLVAAGETRELLLALDDPPATPERATLGGVVALPDVAGVEELRLQLYFQPAQRWMRPDIELSLADLQPAGAMSSDDGGALRAWSFRVEDLPVGRYRIQLFPFLKVWMIDLEAGGGSDVELVLPALAEVQVETVDGGTGARVPRSEFYWRHAPVPGQVQYDLAQAVTEEPGRFRFWAAPGPVTVWPKFPNGAEREFGGNGMDLELVPGFQAVRFEFAPVYAMRFEFREDGTALPTGPQGMHTTRDIRAVDHEGRVTDGGLQRDMVVEVSAAGLYEISFEGIDADRYHRLPPRYVDVHAGETAQVIVDLHPK